MKLKMIFSYDGTNFFGYAKQINKRTVQGEIEKVLFKIFNEEIVLHASGRTDKGVHAINQVADFDVVKSDINLRKTITSLNKLLDNDIYIKDICVMEDSFSARFSAKRKIYEYYINLQEYCVFARNYEILLTNLNIQMMKQCAMKFVGTMDFKNFTSKEEDENGFIRTIYAIDFFKTSNGIKIRFEGNGFMRYQIRKIVGTLIEVGKGKLDIGFIDNALKNNKRDIVTYTAPSNGLFLVDVVY